MNPQRLQKQSRGEEGGSLMRKNNFISIKNIAAPVLEHLLNGIPLIWQILIHEEPMTPAHKVHRYAPLKVMGFELGGWVLAADLSELLPHYSLFCGQL